MPFLYGVLLTLAAESIVFFLFGYKNKNFWIPFLLANIFTNLLINILVFLGNLVLPYIYLVILLYILEVFTVLFEYWIYSKKEGRSMKLFLCTFLANIVSYSVGLLIFGHI